MVNIMHVLVTVGNAIFNVAISYVALTMFFTKSIYIIVSLINTLSK